MQSVFLSISKPRTLIIQSVSVWLYYLRYISNLCDHKAYISKFVDSLHVCWCTYFSND